MRGEPGDERAGVGGGEVEADVTPDGVVLGVETSGDAMLIFMKDDEGAL